MLRIVIKIMKCAGLTGTCDLETFMKISRLNQIIKIIRTWRIKMYPQPKKFYIKNQTQTRC